MAAYNCFDLAYPVGFKDILSHSVNAQISHPPSYDVYGLSRTYPARFRKTEAFLTTDAVFSWSVDVFEFDDTVELSTPQISLSPPVTLPIVVRGLGIKIDGEEGQTISYHPNGVWLGGYIYCVIGRAVVEDGGLNFEEPSGIEKTVEQKTSNTFTPRYREVAFRTPGAVGSAPYSGNRLLGDLLDCAVWVDDIENLVK